MKESTSAIEGSPSHSVGSADDGGGGGGCPPASLLAAPIDEPSPPPPWSILDLSSPTALAKFDWPRANSAKRLLVSGSSSLSVMSAPAYTLPVSESDPESLSESLFTLHGPK